MDQQKLSNQPHPLNIGLIFRTDDGCNSVLLKYIEEFLNIIRNKYKLQLNIECITYWKGETQFEGNINPKNIPETDAYVEEQLLSQYIESLPGKGIDMMFSASTFAKTLYSLRVRYNVIKKILFDENIMMIRDCFTGPYAHSLSSNNISQSSEYNQKDIWHLLDQSKKIADRQFGINNYTIHYYYKNHLFTQIQPWIETWCKKNHVEVDIQTTEQALLHTKDIQDGEKSQNHLMIYSNEIGNTIIRYLKHKHGNNTIFNTFRNTTDQYNKDVYFIPNTDDTVKCYRTISGSALERPKDKYNPIGALRAIADILDQLTSFAHNIRIHLESTIQSYQINYISNGGVHDAQEVFERVYRSFKDNNIDKNYLKIIQAVTNRDNNILTILLNSYPHIILKTQLSTLTTSIMSEYRSISYILETHDDPNIPKVSDPSYYERESRITISLGDISCLKKVIQSYRDRGYTDQQIIDQSLIIQLYIEWINQHYSLSQEVQTFFAKIAKNHEFLIDRIHFDDKLDSLDTQIFQKKDYLQYLDTKNLLCDNGVIDKDKVLIYQLYCEYYFIQCDPKNAISLYQDMIDKHSNIFDHDVYISLHKILIIKIDQYHDLKKKDFIAYTHILNKLSYLPIEDVKAVVEIILVRTKCNLYTLNALDISYELAPLYNTHEDQIYRRFTSSYLISYDKIKIMVYTYTFEYGDILTNILVKASYPDKYHTPTNQYHLHGYIDYLKQATNQKNTIDPQFMNDSIQTIIDHISSMTTKNYTEICSLIVDYYQIFEIWLYKIKKKVMQSNILQEDLYRIVRQLQSFKSSLPEDIHEQYMKDITPYYYSFKPYLYDQINKNRSDAQKAQKTVAYKSRIDCILYLIQNLPRIKYTIDNDDLTLSKVQKSYIKAVLRLLGNLPENIKLSYSETTYVLEFFERHCENFFSLLAHDDYKQCNVEQLITYLGYFKQYLPEDSLKAHNLLKEYITLRSRPPKELQAIWDKHYLEMFGLDTNQIEQFTKSFSKIVECMNEYIQNIKYGKITDLKTLQEKMLSRTSILYQAGGPLYDTIHTYAKDTYMLPHVCKNLNLNNGDTVLDLGCYSGYWGQNIARIYKNMTLNINVVYSDLPGNEKAFFKANNPDTPFIPANMLDDDFVCKILDKDKDKQLDMVFCGLSFDYVNKREIKQAVKNISYILKSGGSLNILMNACVYEDDTCKLTPVGDHIQNGGVCVTTKGHFEKPDDIPSETKLFIELYNLNDPYRKSHITLTGTYYYTYDFLIRLFKQNNFDIDTIQISQPQPGNPTLMYLVVQKKPIPK